MEASDFQKSRFEIFKGSLVKIIVFRFVLTVEIYFPNFEHSKNLVSVFSMFEMKNWTGARQVTIGGRGG